MPSPHRPAGYDPRKYPPFAVTVDVVLLTVDNGVLNVLLVERGRDPYRGALALPGGFVHHDEDLPDAACRELGDETDVRLKPHDLIQLGAYGTPDRDARMRVVSIAYLALVANVPSHAAGSDAAGVALHSALPLLTGRNRLAFDHRTILGDAVQRVGDMIEESNAATRLCEPTFTMADLRAVYEAVWDTQINPSNFQKRVLKTADFLEPTGEQRLPARGRGKLAAVYKRGAATKLHPPIRRPGTYFSD